MTTPTYKKELRFLQTYRFIAGVDEVGRAPLAGPVVAAAVILNPEKIGRHRGKTKWWQGVRDSKLLSPRRREKLAETIEENSFGIGIGWASHEEIDFLNIHYASLLAMKRAIEKLQLAPDLILLDGKFTISGLGLPQQAIVDGDASILSIAAASIIAKVYRDELMKGFAQKYSEYGFEKHKGYPTLFHRKALQQVGPCEIHRMSFSTVRDIMNERFRKLVKA